MKQELHKNGGYDSDEESHTSNTLATSSDEEESEPLFRNSRQNRAVTRFREQSSSMPRSSISPSTGRTSDAITITFTRQRLPWCLCTLAVVAILAMIRSSANTSTVSRGSPRINSSESSSSLPPKLQELGWMDTVEYFRVAMANASTDMWEKEMARQKAIEKEPTLLDQLNDFEKYTVDISPLYDAVVEAVDNIGVKGLVFDVFTPELNEWYGLKEDPECMGSKMHGYNCAHYGFWWFYHYVGFILGERLIQEGHILWDPMTAEESIDFFDLHNKIHEREELPFSWEMSFHVQHGLLQYYALYYMPDMTEFPTKLVEDFCGKWLNDDTKLSNGKQIGFSCAHGFGHMVFNVVASKQIDPTGKYQLNARRQVKPNSGFELNHESFCRIEQICTKAIEQGSEWEQEAAQDDVVFVTDIGDRCQGGAIHSMKLMAATLPTRGENKEKRTQLAQLFNKEQEVCKAERQEMKEAV